MAKGKGKTGYFVFVEAVFKSDLKPHTKLVLLVYADHHDWTNHNGAYPSHATVAKKTGLSKNTVIRHTAILEKSGWLINTGRHYFDRGYTQNYDLTIPKYADRLPKYEATIPNLDPKMGTNQIHETDTDNKDFEQRLNQIQHPADAQNEIPEGLNPYLDTNVSNCLLVTNGQVLTNIREKEEDKKW